jgi:ornithine--oxo-acid transaminase
LTDSVAKEVDLLERLVETTRHTSKEVRGKGLLIGVELHPEAGGARRFCEALQARGVLTC